MTDLDLVVVYCWWGDNELFLDLKNPVLLSIATLRGCGFVGKICLIAINSPCLSDNDKTMLSFLQIEIYYKTSNNNMVFRPFFVRDLVSSYQEEFVLFCDSDVFWRKHPLPFLSNCDDSFCCDFSNTGVYYYRIRSFIVSKFLHLWEKTTYNALIDESLRQKIKDFYFYNAFNDEAVYYYLKRVNLDLPITFMSYHENYHGFFYFDHKRTWTQRLNFYDEVKNYHCLKGQFGSKRGLFALLVSDFCEKINQALPCWALDKLLCKKLRGSINLDDNTKKVFLEFVQLIDGTSPTFI